MNYTILGGCVRSALRDASFRSFDRGTIRRETRDLLRRRREELDFVRNSADERSYQDGLRDLERLTNAELVHWKLQL